MIRTNLGDFGHATSAPANVPMKNAMNVATPSRPTLHGTAEAIFCVTGCGKLTTDTPRSPCAMSTQ